MESQTNARFRFRDFLFQFRTNSSPTSEKLAPNRDHVSQWPCPLSSLWQAGFALAEYMLHHRNVSRLVLTSTQKFSTRNILELGAGVGTTGIILAKQGISTTLSDFTDEVIDNLKSVLLRFSSVSPSFQIQRQRQQRWKLLSNGGTGLALLRRFSRTPKGKRWHISCSVYAFSGGYDHRGRLSLRIVWVFCFYSPDLLRVPL